jgi:hypothetical protein
MGGVCLGDVTPMVPVCALVPPTKAVVERDQPGHQPEGRGILVLLPLIASLTCLAPAETPPTHLLIVSPARRIEATETCTVRGPKLNTSMWYFMAPRPPKLTGQCQVHASIAPGITWDRNELSAHRRPIIEARIPVKDWKLRNEVTVKVKYQAALMSRKLVPAPKGTKPQPGTRLSEVERKLFLASVSLMDHGSNPARKWLREHRLHLGDKEDQVAFARRVFDHVRKSYTYKYLAEQDRRVSALCTQKATDCGGQAVLFVSALRANGIPARVLVGRMAESAKKDGRLNHLRHHVRAEFHAEGIGWVPVDLSEGLFGHDPGDFLVLHVDYDLIFDVGVLGKKTVLLVQQVVSWSTGTGSYEGSSTTHDWHVLPLRR